MKPWLPPLLMVMAAAAAGTGVADDAGAPPPSAEPDAASLGIDLDRGLSSPARLSAVSAATARKANAEVRAARSPPPASRSMTEKGRPFGGVPVSAGSAVWQAEIYRDIPEWVYLKHRYHHREDHRPKWELQHWCGGALIGDGWVLTAAHCVVVDYQDSDYLMKKQDDFLSHRQELTVSKKNGVSLSTCVNANLIIDMFRVRLGAVEIDRSEGVSYKIDCAVVDADWNPKDFTHDDIALVHFAATDSPGVGFDEKYGAVRSHPIELYLGGQPPEDTAVSVTGWGKTRNVPGHDPSAVLMKVDLSVQDSAVCASALNAKSGKLGDGVFCAGAPAKKTCLGDSGGPVVFTEGTPTYLVGVVSWGLADCKQDGKPGVYTRIGAYADWIADVLAADPSLDARGP